MDQPVSFGKYHLLEKLAQGGMAEIYLAKSFGAAGFERLLVIKKILPQMSENTEFINMFIDEARIAASLNHSNVVHINDLGKEGSDYYIAMEFVNGKDLRRIIDRLDQAGQLMPIPIAVLITARICEGLDYAHRRTDPSGCNLKIIHRDVSPGNVLVSYDGDIKLIDFGIAKAQHRLSRTDSSTLKGKIGYMSPEQLRGLPMDHRSDIFSVGILLYEMLTGRQLFGGEYDPANIERVRSAEVEPPTALNPDIPEALSAVVMQALAREPDDRFDWAAQMQDQLTPFVIREGNLVSGKHLALFMRELFATEITAENERLATYRRRGYPWIEAAIAEGADKAAVEKTAPRPAAVCDDDFPTPSPDLVPPPLARAKERLENMPESESAPRGQGGARAPHDRFATMVVDEAQLRAEASGEREPTQPTLPAPAGMASRVGSAEPAHQPVPSGDLQGRQALQHPWVQSPQQSLPMADFERPPKRRWSITALFAAKEISPAPTKSRRTRRIWRFWRLRLTKTGRLVGSILAFVIGLLIAALIGYFAIIRPELALEDSALAPRPLLGPSSVPPSAKHQEAPPPAPAVEPAITQPPIQPKPPAPPKPTAAAPAQKPAVTGRPKPRREAPAEGYLIANTKPPAQILIDGKDTGQWTPLVPNRKLALPVGNHAITFRTQAGKTLTRAIVIKKGEITKVIEEIPEE